MDPHLWNDKNGHNLVRGVFVGRLCPIHRGHEAIISKMVADMSSFYSLVVVGSSNQPQSLRHFFSYEERTEMVKKLFPEVRVVGLPDYPTDREWILALTDLVEAVFRCSIKDILFYVGCEEDGYLLSREGWNVRCVNRFDGSTPKISATEVRDALIHGRDLKGLVSPDLEEYMCELFSRKWEEFKRR